MITKDIKSHLADKYSEHLDTISNMSKSDKGQILVKDERKLYNFDKITEALYRKILLNRQILYMLQNEKFILLSTKVVLRKR